MATDLKLEATKDKLIKKSTFLKRLNIKKPSFVNHCNTKSSTLDRVEQKNDIFSRESIIKDTSVVCWSEYESTMNGT